MVYRWHFHLDLTILQSEIVILIMLDQRLIVVGDIYKIVTRSHTETLLLLLMKETYNSDSLSSKILLWVLKLFRYILKEL